VDGAGGNVSEGLPRPRRQQTGGRLADRYVAAHGHDGGAVAAFGELSGENRSVPGLSGDVHQIRDFLPSQRPLDFFPCPDALAVAGNRVDDESDQGCPSAMYLPTLVESAVLEHPFQYTFFVPFSHRQKSSGIGGMFLQKAKAAGGFRHTTKFPGGVSLRRHTSNRAMVS